METFDLKAAVQRGATWLDEVAPGWHDRIKLGSLDLRSSTLCVAGQGLPEELWTPKSFSNGYAYVNTYAPRPDRETVHSRRDVWNGFTHPDVEEGPVETETLYPEGDAETLGGFVPDPRIIELTNLWIDEITSRRLRDALNV